MLTHNTGSQKGRTFRRLLLVASIAPAEIGRRIQQARLRKRWTQLEFANQANVSPSSVQRWEAGKLPPVRELMRIGELLEVPTDELVEPEADEAKTMAQIRQELAAEVARMRELNDLAAARLAAPAAPRRGRKPA